MTHGQFLTYVDFCVRTTWAAQLEAIEGLWMHLRDGMWCILYWSGEHGVPVLVVNQSIDGTTVYTDWDAIQQFELQTRTSISQEMELEFLIDTDEISQA